MLYGPMKRVEFERLLAFAKSQAVAAGGVEALPEVLATVVTVVGPSKLLIAEAVFFASSKSLSTNVIRIGL